MCGLNESAQVEKVFSVGRGFGESMYTLGNKGCRAETINWIICD